MEKRYKTVYIFFKEWRNFASHKPLRMIPFQRAIFLLEFNIVVVTLTFRLFSSSLTKRSKVESWSLCGEHSVTLNEPILADMIFAVLVDVSMVTASFTNHSRHWDAWGLLVV